MCQRKIIGKGILKIVPLLNGCSCPVIKEIRDTDKSPLSKSKVPPLTHCHDVFTRLKGTEYSSAFMLFRYCHCNPQGHCATLPKMDLYADDEELPDDEDENGDDDIPDFRNGGSAPVKI